MFESAKNAWYRFFSSTAVIAIIGGAGHKVVTFFLVPAVAAIFIPIEDNFLRDLGESTARTIGAGWCRMRTHTSSRGVVRIRVFR